MWTSNIFTKPDNDVDDAQGDINDDDIPVPNLSSTLHEFAGHSSINQQEIDYWIDTDR